MPAYKPARFRRLIAFGIDLGLSYLLILPLLGFIEILPTMVVMFVGPFCVFGFFGLLFGRDYLFCGRSIGKRIMGLAVVDRKTGAIASAPQLVKKNRFLFVYPLDGAALLFSGRSLGERATGTAVIRSREPVPFVDKTRLRKAVAVIAAIATGFWLIMGVATAVLKKSEGYQTACRYLLASESFARSGTEEDDIDITSFSGSSSRNAAGIPVGTNEYTFRVGTDSYTVICHPDENGTWQVCDECTNFE